MATEKNLNAGEKSGEVRDLENQVDHNGEWKVVQNKWKQNQKSKGKDVADPSCDSCYMQKRVQAMQNQDTTSRGKSNSGCRLALGQKQKLT